MQDASPAEAAYAAFANALGDHRYNSSTREKEPNGPWAKLPAAVQAAWRAAAEAAIAVRTQS